MKPAHSAFACVVLFVLLSAAPASADEGMWLVNQPPRATLKSRHGFDPSPEWIEHVQKSAIRMGASGSFVSADGLVMTNHHVVSDQLAKLSTPNRDLLTSGYLASSRADELPCPDMHLEVLMSIEDVTAAVQESVPAGADAAAARSARRKRSADIEQEAERSTGLHCEVVTLYRGAKFHLYRYKSYSDVRLVFAPESAIASFGGDTDNFEYPRFALDMALLRAYENGRPARPQHHLAFSDTGARDGDLAIVFGHPYRTNRLLTVDELRFERDVAMPLQLLRLWSREVQLQGFAGRSAEFARIVADDRGGVENSRKARTGYLAALQDPAVIEAKAADERKLRQFVAADGERTRAWGGAWDALTAVKQAERPILGRYQLLEGRWAGGGSQLFDAARRIVRLADELPKPSSQRLAEYRESALEEVYRELYSPSPVYEPLEIDRIAGWLSLAAIVLGADDPIVKMMLAEQSPRRRAEALVKASKLSAVPQRKSLADGGRGAVEQSDDAMIAFARAIDSAAREIRRKYENEVESVEEAAHAQIAAAQFAMLGEAVCPDATGTLRLSFGPIGGYEDAGQPVPAFTTLGGLFERQQQRGADPAFALPRRWLDAKASLDLKTPLDFVCTADIIGGNSGSPVVDRDGRVIGLIFDSNLQGLSGSVSYSNAQARSIAVDVRAIVEALRKVYGAPALADELTGKSK